VPLAVPAANCAELFGSRKAGKSSRNRSLAVSILPARAQAIRGDRANGVRLKNAFGATPEIMLSFPSVEPGAYVLEKNLHAEAMVGSNPLAGFVVSDREQLRLRD
jgi:hypothetical protein